MAFTLAPFVASTTLTQSAGAIPAFSVDTTLTPSAGKFPDFSLDATLSSSVGRLPAFIATQDGPTTFSFVASGGVQFGGQAPRSFLLNGQPAYDTFSYSLVGSGGMLFGGSASVSAVQLSVHEIYPVGGVKFGGAATVTTSWLEQHPSGGIAFGGAARFVDPVRGSGGIAFGGSAVVGELVATVSASLPKMQVALSGTITQVLTGDVVARFPRVTASLQGLTGSIGRLSAPMPALRAALVGGTYGVSSRLPGMRAQLSGHIGLVAGLSARVPQPTSSISAQFGSAGVVAARLPSVTGDVRGLVGVVGAISAKLAKMTSTAQAAVGVTASLSGRLPTVTASGVVLQTISASISARLPALSGRLTAAHAEDILLTFVTNTVTAASTTYSDYPFNSFCEINGEYFGASDTGLYKLEVEQDDVPFKMTTGFLSFQIPQQKRASDFYINMHSQGDLTLRVSVDEGEKFEYRVSAQDIALLRQRRSLLGKGIRGVYWQFELEGTKDFDFDNYTVAFAPTVRRV